MDRLRTPFFIVAAVALLLAILVELSSVAILHVAQSAGLDRGTPGWGIRYLAILDFLLLYNVVMTGFSKVAPELEGRVQGCLALVLSFFGCLGTIVLVILAFTMLILMVSLLLAVPFGTLAYMAVWGSFPAGTAEGTLALIMLLKLLFCVFLVLAQQDFLTRKSLVLLTAASLGLTWLQSFLIGFPPFFLVSIADVLGALVISIVGLIWIVLLVISSLLSLIPLILSLIPNLRGRS
jgi:hypothetical protein